MTSAISEAMLVSALWMMLSMTVSIVMCHISSKSIVCNPLADVQLEQAIRTDHQGVAGVEHSCRVRLFNNRRTPIANSTGSRCPSIDGGVEIATTVE